MSLPSPIHYIRCFLRAETGLVKTAEFENIGIILFEELKQGAAKRSCLLYTSDAADDWLVV